MCFMEIYGCYQRYSNSISIDQQCRLMVDLVKPLTTYIDSVYNTSDDNKAEISEAVQELNKLRSKACCQPLDRHQSALDVVTRYYDQLASLSLSDGSFERAAILFNCAALMSAIAGSQKFHTDVEIKTSASLFQQAAGIFAKLRDSVLGMVQQDPTPDLMPDTLAALSAIMVAQAQECIYIKGKKDNMKPAAMTKISAQLADFYVEAQKLMAKDVVYGVFDTVMVSTVTGKLLTYQALSQFHQAEVDAENRKIRDQLSRLQEAIKVAETAQNTIGKRSRMDNDLIYHERVTDFRSLAPLPKAALAKPTPITGPLSPKFKDMFSSLVPVQVHNAMQSYEARKAELINMETVRMREATQLMNGFLSSLNLPASLDDVTSTEILPESIRRKSIKLKENGGLAEILRLLRELPSFYQRNEEILSKTSRVLNNEKESDDTMRKQLSTKWNRMPSDQLTGPLVQEIGKFRKVLHTALEADRMNRYKFNTHRQMIELLSKNESVLKAAIPGQTAHSTGETETVRKLKELMKKWTDLTQKREQLEKDLKSTNCDIATDFLRALAESQLINEEQISKEKINELFGALRNRVQKSLNDQEALMNEIQTWNNKFSGEKAVSDSGLKRERFLTTLAQAADVYAELRANLEEGTKFYNILTPILARLQQKVSDFVFARQAEKEDLMRQLQLSIVSGAAQQAVVGAVSSYFWNYVTGTTAADPPIPPSNQYESIDSLIPQIGNAQNSQGQSQSMTFQPTFSTPYPNFPGAFPSYQQQGYFPPNTRFPKNP
ncbi:unnamed protein product [Caenorhabditis angaria]|uniref:BRO1 domain-containing protein n=1 Tax=Caenorhabditis angaria TaxID=860376 RepID=A0A9P1IIY8_9PELO|nr:unnamed protein product [Caenorhabditis angaria]